MINTHARKHTFILQGSPDHTPLAGETIVDRTEIIFPLLKVVDLTKFKDYSVTDQSSNEKPFAYYTHCSPQIEQDWF